MLTNSKIALSLALVLAAASAATAAPRRVAHHQTTLAQQIPANAYMAFASAGAAASAPSRGPANQASNISPRGLERLEHLIEGFEDIASGQDLGN